MSRHCVRPKLTNAQREKNYLEEQEIECDIQVVLRAKFDEGAPPFRERTSFRRSRTFRSPEIDPRKNLINNESRSTEDDYQWKNVVHHVDDDR